MFPHMRTTLTLDDDVFLLLGRRQSESGGTFKDAVRAKAEERSRILSTGCFGPC